jgi:HD superfamily phosphohydrolase
MPGWGLTEAMRDAKPWKLPADVLEPGKVITDPIHGDVYLTLLEQAVVDSRAFQRLRRVRQLGTTHLVYPGATHTRFAHSLGALRVAQNLLDATLGQGETRHGRPDLFRQWRTECGLLRGKEDEASSDDRRKYTRMVAEAVVLARLGALLHDICHVAYGHTTEDDLQVLTPHDCNTQRFDAIWSQIGQQRIPLADREAVVKVADVVKPALLRQLKPLILSKAPRRLKQRKMAYPFVEDLVGNTICADLIDYLQRDHTFAGLPISLGQRYMTGFYVRQKGEAELFPARMVLNIEREGKDRADVISELLKHLRYRYELQERVIVHHAKLAADAMVGKMLELASDALWTEAAWSYLGEAGLGEGVELPAQTEVDALREQLAEIDTRAPIGVDSSVKADLETMGCSNTCTTRTRTRRRLAVRQWRPSRRTCATAVSSRRRRR